MTLYGSLIVNSKDIFSDYYCQTRVSQPLLIGNDNISYKGILKH
jgi:hypothetical protein